MSVSRGQRIRMATIIPIFILLALIGGHFLKCHPLFAAYLRRLPLFSLVVANGFFVFSGLPLSIVGDLLLLNKIGLKFIVIWPAFVGLASCLQIYFFRNAYSFTNNISFFQRLRAKAEKASLPRITKPGFLVLFIRSVPVLPFMVGSFIISLLPGLSCRSVILGSVFGSYFYYIYFAAGYYFAAGPMGS
jgi:hypothetical protein